VSEPSVRKLYNSGDPCLARLHFGAESILDPPVREVFIESSSVTAVEFRDGGITMAAKIETNSQDETTLERLNNEYIQAYMSADVRWYDKHLADEFTCIESDGSVLDKTQFLRKTTEGPDVADYKLVGVHVRIYGRVALVQGTGKFTRKDQSSGVSRYTDVYIQTGEGWKAVSAQITRTSR
jgi:hypothetical protein